MPRPRYPRIPAALALLLLATAGCGNQLGALLFTFMPPEKIPAEFKLPKGTVLILVDDVLGSVQPPLARLALAEALAKQFKDHKIAEHTVSGEQVARLQQSVPEFDQLSISEVARRTQADIVLWLNVEDFSVEENLELVVQPAKFSVKLKVFDVRAKKKQDLRIWPPGREGRMVNVSVGPKDVRACKSMAEVHRKMADQLADEIAKLFYDHTVER